MSIRLKMLFATLPALAACASVATVGTAPGDAAPPDSSHDVVTVFMDVPGREDAADALTLPDVAPVDTAVPPDVVPADATSADATPDVIDAAVEAALDAADDAAPDVRDGAVEAASDASVDTMPDVGEDVPVDRVVPDASCTPTPERCNNVDDNCDGTIDEPFLGGGGSLQLLALSTTGCVTVEHLASTGDDRGGIASTAQGMMVTGDVGTATFPLTLTPQASTGRQYDALTSNLRTGQAYTLANGTTPLPYGGGSVTTLLALDGVTGATTGAVVTLSRPITLASGSGIFAGWDRVVLHDGGTSHVYNIALPSGAVTDLGAVAMPAHQSCETWAFWGVAEYSAGTLSEAYVRDGTTIERMAVPSGARSVVATFSNLADMCAFTVSPAAERWYFHHEGTSQFRAGDETAGSCDARIRWSGWGLGDACYAGVGACMRLGRLVCDAAGRDTTCSAVAGTPTMETCNGLDDDCDGVVDSVTRPCYGGPPGTTGVGRCRAGAQTCAAGAWGSACVGEERPAAETCNGVDDDCDGVVDDGLFCPSLPHLHTPPHVLFYGPNGANERPYLPTGSVATVASDAMWRAMTAAQFADYDLIVIGDKDCSGATVDDTQAAYDTRATWLPNVNGRIFVSTLDPGCHLPPAAQVYLRDALTWLVAAGGTALYVSGDWGRRNFDYLSPLGTFSSMTMHADDVRIVTPPHAVVLGSTDARLSDWGSSYHAIITAFPSTFTRVLTNNADDTLALVRDIVPPRP